MPNEVTSLLNTLNSYITCPVCKVTNEIEIILTCGHLICKKCKTKRTKCPVCYSELSATRQHSASIKFIKELSKELVKASTDDIHCVEPDIDVGTSIITPNVKGEQTTRNGFRTISNEKIKKKYNVRFKEDVEINNDHVKVINEINTFRNKDNNRKNSNHKKRFICYEDYCKHKEEQKVYKNILKGFGIAGIDKKIKKFKSEHTLSAREIELNGQLNTIISRLNDHYAKNDNLENTKFNDPFKMNTDNDSSDSDQNSNVSYKTAMNSRDSKDGFGFIKCNLKRSGLSLIKTCGGLKRKNVDTGHEEGPCNKAFVSNTGSMDDCVDFDTVNNLVNLDKKLGGIVDETEIVQRYLNLSTKTTGKENIQNEIKTCSNLDRTHNSSVTNKSEFRDEVPPITDKINPIEEKSGQSLSKSEINNIISGFIEETSPNSEEDGLQSDIMADMLHNVSNEIVIVGNTLCAAEKISEICKRPINGSYVVNNLKNHSLNTSPCKPIVDEMHSLTIKSETANYEYTGDNIIVVSDSEDDVEVIKKLLISNSSQTRSDQADINLEKDADVMNCNIVLQDLLPLPLKSECNTISMDNGECLAASNVKKKLSKGKTSSIKKMKVRFKSAKKAKLDIVGKKSTYGNNSVNLTRALPKVPLGQKRDRCNEAINNFEGFTEDDILILTVKLALFKMNGCKYSKNLPSSSLYALDGKQILIKDVSQEDNYPDSPCYPNKIGKSLVTSSVQTDNDVLTVTPSPSASKIRPVSLVKLRGFEIENEKFMQNDVLDIRKPLTPNTPIGKESITSSFSQNSPVLISTPVSRRQLSFMSPSFEKNLQYQDDGASTSGLKSTESVSNSILNDDWQVLHNRMQHMIHSNPEDALHSEFEHSSTSATRLTFTTCGLNSKETALVTKLAQMTKSCLTKDFTHSTTHLVIGATGRGRLEYYLAIAYRAFIVTMDWVTLCLALNKILPVTGFIPTEDEGPLKCLEPNSLPFVGFHVFSKILPTSSSYPIAEITKTLLSLGGARVLPSLDAFHTLQDGNYPRFFIYNSKSLLTQAILDKCASLHILPIQFMWVYESIGAFRAIPVMDFLDIGVHSRTLIRDYKIPDQLACSRYPRLEGEFHPQILDERYQRSL